MFYKEYNEFVDKFSSPQNGIGVKYFTINGIVLRTIFINSSWSLLSHKPDENMYSKLAIGDTQLDEIKNKLLNRKKKYDFTIACLHHPLDWFEYDERQKLQDFLYNVLKTDFILHGHIHEASYDSIFNMDSSTNIFCTGISYTVTGEHCSRKDGMRYSIYELDKDTRTVNVYLRATNKQLEFVEDNRLYSNVAKNGFFTVPMGNISECLIPIRSVDEPFKNYLFLSRDTVELILKKEEKLFRYYCGMDATLDQMLKKDTREKFIAFWKSQHRKKNLSRVEREKCEKDFYKEQFELYCMHILNTLNGLFFSNHQDVRFLLRRYNPNTNKHVAVFAEGIHSSMKELENVKSFPWGKGMIYNSYKKNPHY